jgi:aspartate/methionine/tyrosine aminotransferase
VHPSRFRWNLGPNPLSLLLQAKRAAGAAVLDLTESNPTRAQLVYPAEIICGALADPRALLYEPAPAGLAAAREAVANDYYQGQTDPSRILLTASTSEAYAYLIKLLTEPGDEILVPRPSYPLFEYLAGLESVRIAHYPLLYEGGWSIPMEAMAESITARTRAVVLVNPNNPTGSFLKKEELGPLLELCLRHGLAIISDEVFSDYGLAADPRRVRSLTQVDETLTFCLSGLSKVSGLPQMKLGWIVTGGPEAERGQSMERLEVIADTYLSVSTPVQHAAAALLKIRAGVQEQILRRTRRNLAALAESTSTGANRTLQVEGGWYAVVQTPRIRTAEEWTLELLERCDVLVQPGYLYDFDREGLLVFSLLTPPEIFDEGLRRFVQYSGE